MAESWDVTDKMLAYLIERADALAAHPANPRAEAELERVVNLIESYEASAGLKARWRAGRADRYYGNSRTAQCGHGGPLFAGLSLGSFARTTLMQAPLEQRLAQIRDGRQTRKVPTRSSSEGEGDG